MKQNPPLRLWRPADLTCYDFTTEVARMTTMSSVCQDQGESEQALPPTGITGASRVSYGR